MRERIDFELDVIKSMGFSAYFLVVWDLVHYAKSRGIRVGPGRGSAAGSCVAYCLRIVDIDPIKYDLLFERFLNPGRKEMPDIDMDFDSRYRGEMIRYAAQKYGDDHVAQVVTFSTIKARAAVRDAARVLGYPYAVGDKIAKLMPPLVMGRDTPLHACFEQHDKYVDGYKMATELRQLYDDDPDARRDHRRRAAVSKVCAARTASTPPRSSSRASRSPSTSPCSASPSRACRIEQSPIVTQYEMNGVQELGPAEDGLPRAAQPRCDGDRARADRGVHRKPSRHRPRPARRSDDVRPAAAGRDDRRVPARRRPDARADPLARAETVRGRVRARRALPARARWARTCTTSTPTARTGASPSCTTTKTSRRSSRPRTG